MRRLPQRGFSWAIVAISSRTSADSRGRPIGPRERQRQKKEILEHRLNIMPLSARSRPGPLLHPYSENIYVPQLSLA